MPVISIIYIFMIKRGKRRGAGAAGCGPGGGRCGSGRPRAAHLGLQTPGRALVPRPPRTPVEGRPPGGRPALEPGWGWGGGAQSPGDPDARVPRRPVNTAPGKGWWDSGVDTSLLLEGWGSGRRVTVDQSVSTS